MFLFWSLVVPIIALVLGWIALRRLRHGEQGGRGLAIAGTVLGGVALLAFITLSVAIWDEMEETLVVEDFSSDRPRFSTDSDPMVDLSVVNGTYRIRVKDPSSPQTMRTFFDRSRGGLSFEAEVTQLTGPEEASLAAIGCWTGDAAYLLVLTATGEAGILETISDHTGERRPLSDLASVDSARPRGEPNRLRLACVGGGRGPTVVSGWVNGEPVSSVAVPGGYDSFSAVGFWVATAEPAEYSMDNVRAVEGRPKPPLPPAAPVEPE